jgi:ABC-type nitrate/sulfonate/bicarbonate transport system substrate-binding protein
MPGRLKVSPAIYLGVLEQARISKVVIFLKILLDRSGKWVDNKKSMRVRTRKLEESMKVAKKLLAAVCMVFIITGTSFAIGDKDQAGTSSDRVLTVGVLVSTVGIPALYAQDQGWFKEAGLNVDLQIFATGVPVNEAIAAGRLDIACSGFASIYSLANGDCVWLMDINSTGGMGIFARRDSPVVRAGSNVAGYPNILGSAATVRGLEILGPVGAAPQYMVEGYAARLGLRNTDARMLNMEYVPAYQAFVSGQGSLNATNPPTSYTMQDEGYIKVCSFEDATGVSLMDGCFARSEIVRARPDDVQKFVNVIIRAMDALQDQKTRFDYSMQSFIANGTRYTDDILNREIADRDYIGTRYVSNPTYVFGEAWGAITAFLVRNEKIVPENGPNVAKSLDPGFLSRAVGQPITKYSGN